MDSSEELGPTLDRAKKTLRNALDEACSADVDEADTGELIRIEEVLAIANEAAKEAVSVRRRLKKTEAAAPPSAEQPASREIEDAHGVLWTVFAVYPSARSGRPAVHERYRQGWLTFNSSDETRRIAPIPSGWRELSDEQLLALSARAECSPLRRRAPNQQLPDSQSAGGGVEGKPSDG